MRPLQIASAVCSITRSVGESAGSVASGLRARIQSAGKFGLMVVLLATATLVRAESPADWEAYFQWRNSFYQDEHGVIDTNRMLAARQAALRLPLNPRILPAKQLDANGRWQPMSYRDPVSNALITPADWTWRGPGNIGGRTRSLLIHPTQTNRMWLGSVGGGLWYSSNSGSNWAPVDDFMSNLAITSLVMDPTNSNIMYAGTGEGFFNSDAVRGAGVFKSTDGGVVWTQMPATATADFNYVNRLAISPDGTTLLAATSTGIHRSTNGGNTWTLVQATASRMTQVLFDPNDSTKAVAAGYAALAFYSTNGGLTWTAASGLPAAGTGSLPGRSELAYARSAPGVIYNGYWNNGTASLYKSTTGGQSYSQIAVSGSTNWMSAQGWYDNTIWVDPTDANRLIVGGLDLYRSTNGGVNLTKISTWQNAPASAHADHHGIFNDPGYNGTTNTRVYFVNDGGIYKAENALTVPTSAWTELNNNLGITQFYGAAGNPTSLTVVAGAQDNGSLRGLSGVTEGWTAFNGGDGGYVAADQGDPNYFYTEYVYATIARSSNAGASAADIWTGITDANVNTGAEFIAPFILDPNNQSRMYVGGKSLWRSNDVKAATPAWTAIKPAIGAATTDNIVAIAVAPGNADLIYVGHRNGNVYKTVNGTAATPTWTQVDTNGVGLPNRRVGRIVFDPNNVQRVYVCFGGYADSANFGATNLWRTVDGAGTWTNVTNNLPLMPIYGLAIRPDNSNVLYAATDLGVYGSEDAGATWSATNVGPATVSTADVFFMAHYLVAGTHGRGVFQVPVLPPPPDVTPPTLTTTPATTVTNFSPVAFRFGFSEAVTGFSAASVSVTGGTKGAMTGSGATYFLPVTPTAPNTPVTVTVAAGAVNDLAGNPLAAGSTATVTYDPTALSLYATNFDGASAPPAWKISSTEWIWGIPTKGPNSDHTGAGGKLYATKLSANYSDGAYDVLTSQPATIPAGSASNPYRLSFWMWLSTETDFDGGNLEVSVNGGPFTVVPGASLSTVYNSNGGLDGLLGQPGWMGTASGLNTWTRVTMGLAAYAGSTVQFRLVFGSDSSVNSTGWFIDDFAIEQTQVTPVADLSISKTDGVASVNAGANTTYTIVASNPAAVAVSNVAVADTFAAALSACTWTCTASAGGSCQSPSGSGNIATTSNSIGAAGTLTFSATCTVSAAATGTLANTATVSYANDPGVGNNSATDTDTIATQADLTITKTDGVTTLNAGANTTYTIVANNPSANVVSNVGLADTFAGTLSACTWTCTASAGGSCQSPSGSGNIATTSNSIAAAGTLTFSATCTLSAAATGSLANTATVSYANDPTPANNSATDTDTIVPQANLAITKTDGVTTLNAGANTTYTIVASNPAAVAISNVAVADAFAGTLSACTWTCTASSGGTCQSPSGSGNIATTTNSIAAAGTLTFSATCTLSAAATGSLANTATVSYANDPTPANNSATDTDTIVAQANLAITKTDGVTTLNAGANTTYTIVASNPAAVVVSNVGIADTFAGTLSACTWTCTASAGGTCQSPSGSGNIATTSNSIAAAGTLTFSATCTLSAAATGSLANTATVSYANDPTPANNSATDTDTIVPQVDLSITKTDGVTTLNAGANTTYTIVASNPAAVVVSNVGIADTFAGTLSACTWTCTASAGGTCQSPSGSGNIATTTNSIAATGTLTFSATCTLSAAATGTLVNTASVSYVNDPAAGNNSATDTDTIVPQADLTITKTDGVTTLNAGANTTYTLVASNPAAVAISNVAVADTFAGTLSACTWTCTASSGGTCQTPSGSGNIATTTNSIAAAGTLTFSATCTLSAAATGTLVNTASVSYVNDPTAGNNSATDTDTIVPQVDSVFANGFE